MKKLAITLGLAAGLIALAIVAGEVCAGWIEPGLNPYEGIDWATVGRYKANLHAHTIESDGASEPEEVIDAYYYLGYSILALTDHDICGRGGDWEHPAPTPTWPWEDYGRNPEQLGMVAVQGNEISNVHHIGSYFNDYGDPNVGTEEEALTQIGLKDGLAVFFHPNIYDFSPQWYAGFYRDHEHLVGMEVASRNFLADKAKEIWDQVLTELMPGRPVWGFGNDDNHEAEDIGFSWTTFLLDELSAGSARQAMETGRSYFSQSSDQCGSPPILEALEIDRQAGKITISASNPAGSDEPVIKWISNGAEVAVGASFDYFDHNDILQPGYLRAEIQSDSGTTYTQPLELIPALSANWLLPAGAVKIGSQKFDTYILVANPTEQTAPVEVRFVGESGLIAKIEPAPVVGPKSRKTIKISDFVAHTHPNAGAVSTIVTSLDCIPVLCERAMYWPGGTGWTSWTGGHDTIGINGPAKEWSLPEGATHIFDEYIHVLNPGDSPAQVEAVFMDQDGNIWTTSTELAALSNWTIAVAETAGERAQVSTRVSSDKPVAVDRTMYWPKGGPSAWRGGHCSQGISSPSTVWYLAEGANHFFDHYVLVSNPTETETANVVFTFRDQNGNTATRQQAVEPQRRYTVKVINIPGWEGKGQVSTVVESTNGVPVAAERAMYWPKGGPAAWRGGHDSIGASAAAVKWYLPEGANHIFEHYVLVFNPSEAETANVVFTFMDRNGNTVTHQQAVGPQRRYTVKVNNIPGWETKDQVSTVVESTNSVPVVAERAMYWPKGSSSVWTDGHATVGIAEE